jgi:hypothetical protein
MFFLMAAVLVATFALIIAFDDLRRERILAYLDPWNPKYAQGKAYQLTHSLIAIGRGEIFGQGLGASVEKLHYLPEAHTDFLLAVIGEELGFVGVAIVIVLFFWLTRRIFVIGRQAIALDRVFAGLMVQGIGCGWAPGLHQHGREPGRAADQGPDAAADELWRIGHPDEPGRDGDGAAGGSMREAARALMRGGKGLMTHLVIMAAGTGGHIIPGLAVAREMQGRGWSVSWLGTATAWKTSSCPRPASRWTPSASAGLRGKGLLHWPPAACGCSRPSGTVSACCASAPPTWCWAWAATCVFPAA